MNIKVLIITGSYPPNRCGIGDYSCNLAKALALNAGVSVGVLTSVVKEKIDNVNGVEIFAIVKKWSLAEALKVIRTIRQWSPDIVHIQYPAQGYGDGLLPWLLPMFSFLMKKKVVQTWHEAYGRRDAFRLLLKSIIPGALIFVRPRYRESLHPMLRWALWKKNPVTITNASTIPHVDLDQKKRIELKRLYLKKQKRLIVFFGFIYPHKGIDLLFEIADPALDQIVIAGENIKKENFKDEIMKLSSVTLWGDKVTVTGFLPATDIGELLAVADAVILPFRGGGGEWNTSIHGAVLNRTFVITTSLTKNGYDKKHNVYFAKVDDIQEMRSALFRYAGMRREYDADIDKDVWQKIAEQHRLLYESILNN